jgi:mannose-6-phosphate isomerase
MSKVESRIIPKPWGSEEIWAETESYVGKRMYIDPGQRMSLQYHEQKEETIFVLHGTLRIWNSKIDNDYIDLVAGEVYHVEPKQVHRFGCPKDSKFATSIMEVSTPYLTDVIRLQDDYSRT